MAIAPVLIAASASVPLGHAAPAAPTPAAVPGGLASVPRPDHVVIVIEENHSGSGIIGNPDAPYINTLAAENANMSQSYALTHPSQPNYIALFSGATQGITDDTCPHSLSTPNLGSSLLDAGLGFAGYSEGLPAAGSTACTSGKYVRKHNPWVDFPAIPASANQPMTAFPSDYSTLPAVSVVVPNLTNDMHDGTVAQGDTWVKNTLSGYVEWAKTHNSLFVLTFDEDDNHEGNRIPTIFAGQQIRPGSYSEKINHYNVLRTLEDAYGLAPVGASATSAPILDIWAAPADDAPPVAAFTSSCTQLMCSFDASASTDPDGTIADYRWTFGDGATGSGPAPPHTYAVGGTYPVSLTVVDDRNVATTVEHDVSVLDPPGAVFVSDAFGRTVTGGWGSADVGGLWTLTGGASAFSVTPGTGSIRLAKAGSQAGTYQAGVVRPDADVVTGLKLSTLPVGGPAYLTVQGRRVTSSEDYSAKVLVNPDRSISLLATRRVGGVEKTLATAAKVSTYAPGTQLDVRIQVSGTSPSTVRARVWPDSGVEPSTWQVSATDSSAGLQAGGSVGVQGYLSSSSIAVPITVGVTSVTAKPPSAGPAAVAPTAAFTASCAQLACSFDGSGSTDPDGAVVTWAWDFGDGTTGSGPRPVHGYVVGGLYDVTLTVTADSGRTGTVVHRATATPPPDNTPPTAAFTSTCTRLSCSFDGTGSTDDEAVEEWSWDFGDGSTGTGPQPSHAFAADGTYIVRLTVLDDDDATDAVSHSVVVAAASTTPVASDAFGRTVPSGWGSADVGGAWSLSGSATVFSVAPGAGSVRLAKAGSQAGAYLAGVARTDVDLVTGVRSSVLPVGGPLYVTVQGRRVTASDEYAASVLVNPDRSVTVGLTRRVGGTQKALLPSVRVPGLSYVAGTSINVRLQVSGVSPTSVRARVWAASAAEPAGWQVSATDTTAALQKPGAVGIVGYLSGSATNAPVTLGVTSVTARPTG